MATPTFVAAGTGAASTGTPTPGMPAGATTDDILILVIENWGYDSTSAAAAPTGGDWTLVGSASSGAGDGAEVDKTTCTVYWAVYNAAINLTVPDTGNHTIARVYAFRGCDTTNPFDATATGNATFNTTSHSAATGLTTTVADTLVCLGFTHGDDTQSPTGVANTSLTSVSDGGGYESTEGNDGLVWLWYGTRAVAGTGGTYTWSTTGSEEKAWVAFALQEPQSVVVPGVDIDFSTGIATIIGGNL